MVIYRLHQPRHGDRVLFFMSTSAPHWLWAGWGSLLACSQAGARCSSTPPADKTGRRRPRKASKEQAADGPRSLALPGYAPDHAPMPSGHLPCQHVRHPWSIRKSPHGGSGGTARSTADRYSPHWEAVVDGGGFLSKCPHHLDPGLGPVILLTHSTFGGGAAAYGFSTEESEERPRCSSASARSGPASPGGAFTTPRRLKRRW
jgi:hypothetical protein